MPKWRNRQTRYVQGVVPVRAWEFKSPLRHQVPDPVFRVSTFTNEDAKGRMVAGCIARGKSELHRAWVPGESRGGASGRRQSRLARGSPRESNRDHVDPANHVGSK